MFASNLKLQFCIINNDQHDALLSALSFGMKLCIIFYYHPSSSFHSIYILFGTMETVRRRTDNTASSSVPHGTSVDSTPMKSRNAIPQDGSTKDLQKGPFAA